MDIQTILREAGIAGAGGAGFPSYAKQASPADTLVINGAECEPLLYTDYTLLRERREEVLRGAELLLDHSGMRRALLAVETRKAGLLGLSDGMQLSPRVTVSVLPEAYPMGDEISLVWQTLGRLIRPGTLPASAGVIVQNVESVYNSGRAIADGIPVTEKWVTVTGDVPKCTVLRVPVGTPVREIFARLGITVPEGDEVFDGGPAMGRLIDPETSVVRKTTKALTVLPASTQAVIRAKRTPASAHGAAVTACCQCSRCTDLCPRALLGYPLEPHKMVRAAALGDPDPVLIRNAALCCGCGICESVACSQGISPKQVIMGFKEILRAQKIAFTPDPSKSYAPDEARDGRLIPASRMKAILGVSRFDRLPVRVPDAWYPTRVEIPLQGHIGKPSVPCVQAGDTVKAGDLIAEAADGLSLPQHASVPGRVLSVDRSFIIIETAR